MSVSLSQLRAGRSEPETPEEIAEALAALRATAGQAVKIIAAQLAPVLAEARAGLAVLVAGQLAEVTRAAHEWRADLWLCAKIGPRATPETLLDAAERRAICQ